MAASELGQSREDHAVLIGFLSFVGLMVGVFYIWLFKRPIGEVLYILPLAVLGTMLIFTLFILIIHFIQKP